MNRTRTVKVGGREGITFGEGDFKVIAGPCAVESREQFLETAVAVKEAGAAILRGGLFKLRTDPRAFQGLGWEGVALSREIRDHVKMPFVTEVTDPRQIESLAHVVDMFQVGTRNMYNYALLKELGASGVPVLLKRGFSAQIDEWLLAAQYIVEAGNPNVVLCERGIRTFERATRNTLDLSAVAYVKRHTTYPVIVDPSHGTGRSELIAPLSAAALAVGADGLMVEVHDHPEEALSDGRQALTYGQFRSLMAGLKRASKAFKGFDGGFTEEESEK